MSRSPNAQRMVPCMPPLLEEECIPLSRENGDTRFGGTACEVAVKNYFLLRSINIAEPQVDVGVDLLIEKPEGWVRGQVKKVVYQNRIDRGLFERSGKKVYRSNFQFFFNNGRLSPKGNWLRNGRNQKSPKDFDYFYHVLLTPYRQFIWEIPVSLIPLREDGTFITANSVTLDRDNWKRKKANIDWKKHLIQSSYDPIVFKKYPDFFSRPEPITLDMFA